MGKVKARRFRNCRQDPLAGGGSKRARGRDEAYQPSPIQTSPLPSSSGPAEKPPAVISKLCSDCTAADKDYACRCVANFVFNRNYLKQLLKHGVVSKLSTLFLDDSVSVREVAAGAFRNLSLMAEPSAESKVASDEVLATLPVLIRECHCTLNSKSSVSPVALELWMSVAEQALHVLWNIVELSTDAVEAVQREQLLPVLVEFTQHHWTLATPSAQCLYSVLEDNPAMCGMLAGSGERLQQLSALLTQPKEVAQQEESQALVVRTAVCGVLHSVLPYLPPSHSPELVAIVCGTLGSVLDTDPFSVLHSAAPLADQGPDQRPPNKDTAQECADVRRCLAAQQLALEVLANMTCGDDDDDEWEDMEEEVVGDGGSMLVEGEAGDSPSELTRCILQHCLHEKVWTRCHLTDHKALQVLRSNESLHSLQQYVVAVQSTALMCLQNLVSFLPPPSWTGPLALQQLWETLLQSLPGKDGQVDSADLLEATLGTLRAVLGHLDIQCVTNSQLEFLCVFVCTPSLPPPVITSAVQLVGKLARAATPATPSEGALQVVARAFSEVLSTSSDVWVQAEVLDCVFDVFGESDSSAPVVASSGLLASLCAVQPVFADKLKEGGRDQAVIEVARTNLPRFIQYVQEQLSLRSSQPPSLPCD